MFTFEWEWDAIWMTLVVFMPSVFALGLLFFPRGKENAMCWWSLAGTAVTLGIAIAIFINYKVGVLDQARPLRDRLERSPISLDSRVRQLAPDVGSSRAIN